MRRRCATWPMLSLRFLLDALDPQGKCRNRMNRHGAWEDSPALDDCWGRMHLGAGHRGLAQRRPTRYATWPLDGLERAMRQRSPWPRAMAFAALGAAELLSVDPDDMSARTLLSDAADSMTRTRRHAGWPWPEQRLTYANATLPEAMIAAGSALDRPVLLQRGLDLLEWLLDRETRQGHLSVTPVGGSGPEDHGPGFDQQPIEVAALADACARAEAVDGNRRWVDGITAAADWFLGDNDGAVVMWDPATGGAFDGLESDGANLNQGTESTLALLSTLQHARSSAERLAMTVQDSTPRPSQPGPHCGRQVASGDPPVRPGARGLRPARVAILHGLATRLGAAGRRGSAELRRCDGAVRGSTSWLDRDVPPARRRALRSPRPGTPTVPDPPPAAWCHLHE